MNPHDFVLQGGRLILAALLAVVVLAGCGGGDFCPDNPVTRAQMAVFLAKALGLHHGP